MKNTLSNQFVDEEVRPIYGYSAGYPYYYTKLKSIIEQTNILRQLIQGIGFVDEKFAK